MERRDLLKTATVLAAGAALPRGTMTSWASATGTLAAAPALTDAQRSLVGAIADTLIPRTTTPGAVDVGVPVFVDVFVSESFTARERRAFSSGLAVVEVYLRDDRGRAFVDLPPATRAMRLADIEDQGVVYRAVSKLLRGGEPRRTYWKLKELVVHGYFTSEPVAKGLLEDEVTPGRFDGAAPVRHA